VRLWKWHPDARVPGTALAWACCNQPAASEGKRIAAEMKGRPAGQRGILIQDLGGGDAPDEMHLWSAKGRSLTTQESDGLYRRGYRLGSLDNCITWLSFFWDSYAYSGGPAIDFLCANVELMPDAHLPKRAEGFELPQMLKARKWRKSPLGVQRDQDRLREWACSMSCAAIDELLEYIYHDLRSPSFVSTNVGATGWKRGYKPRDKNGQLLGNYAAGVPAPMLYLTEWAKSYDGPSPISCLALNTALWMGTRKPAVACLPSPCWAGEPGTVLPDTYMVDFNGRKWPTKDVAEWGGAYSALSETIKSDRPSDVVTWMNDGKVFGPAPSEDAVALMREVWA
jgi:hypothetical protein